MYYFIHYFLMFYVYRMQRERPALVAFLASSGIRPTKARLTDFVLALSWEPALKAPLRAERGGLGGRRTLSMEWNRSDTIALAKNCCVQCHGIGLYLGRGGRLNPCNCVLRAIFRACLSRFQHCATKEKHMSRISLEFIPGRERNLTWGRKDEEYMADFILVSRRHLDDAEY